MIFLLPFLLGLAHGASDASAGLLVGLIIQQKSPQMNVQILLYNLLAFGFQPIVGLLFDRIRQPKSGAVTGLLLSILGLLMTQLNLSLAILLIGLGSACLHAGGGSIAITSTPGKASGVGVFAAFGVVGLTLGGVASISHSAEAKLGLVFLLAVLAAIIFFTKETANRSHETASNGWSIPYLAIIVLIIAIAMRSTVWVGTQMSLERYSSAAIWVALAAGTGKLLGGFAADRVGWWRWMFASLIGALFLLVFTTQWLPAMMLGVLLLQSATPLSIASLGRALPQFPATAAALAFGTAILAGGLPFFILANGWFGTGLLTVTLLLSILLYGYFFLTFRFEKSKNP